MLSTAATVPTASRATLPSPLPGVGSEAWTRFVHVLCRAPLGAVSVPAGFLGCFEMHPRRLAEIGVMSGAHRSDAGWTSTFTLPLTREAFLASYVAQYNALVASVRGHLAEIAAGEVKLPTGVTRSGALAILHRAGRGGLAGWAKRKLPETVALFTVTNGIF